MNVQWVRNIRVSMPSTDYIKGIIRPYITWGFTTAYILTSVLELEQAVGFLEKPTMLILGFWFAERAIGHARNGE